jgi:integration host factor subunit alpha
VTKNDLSDAVYHSHGGLSRAEALQVVDLMFSIIRARLMRGEKVLLSGFGCFRVVQRRDRKGVNPRTGEPLVIKGRKAVVFTPGGRLKVV